MTRDCTWNWGTVVDAKEHLPSATVMSSLPDVLALLCTEQSHICSPRHTPEPRTGRAFELENDWGLS